MIKKHLLLSFCSLAVSATSFVAGAANLPAGWSDQSNGMRVTYSALSYEGDQQSIKVRIKNSTGAAKPYVLFLQAETKVSAGTLATVSIDVSLAKGSVSDFGLGYHLFSSTNTYLGEAAASDASQISLQNVRLRYSYKVAAGVSYVAPRISLYTVPSGGDLTLNIGLASSTFTSGTPTPTPSPAPVPTPVPTPVATPTPVPTPVANAYYVSPNGNDNNTGSFSAPFLTLTRAQSAMQSSSIKTAYLRAGNYAPTLQTNCSCAVNIGSADNGETWSYYPADGVNSASIFGGAINASSGAPTIFHLSGESNVTFNGLKIHGFLYAGINSEGASKNLTIENCEFADGYTPFASGNPGAIALYGANNAALLNNVIHDVAAPGIDVGNVNGDISNLLISGNVVYNACTSSSDCGAIYVIDATAKATNIRILNNYVRDGNTFASLGSGAGSAIYLDDCTSGITVTGNILTGRNGTNTVHIHGGSNNHFSGNLTDLGTYQQNIMNVQTDDQVACANQAMSNNTYQSSIIIGAGGGGGYGLLSGNPLNSPQIANNIYHSYGSAAILTKDDFADANPVVADPLLSGRAYTLSPASPAYSVPVSFPALPSHWGPPGYVINALGSAPSSPH